MLESLAGEVPPEPVVSPGLAADRALGRAFELKYRLGAAEADAIEAWARRHLAPDAHGNDGTYPIVSAYCDTAAFDVYHRTPGYRRNKFRLRRYGDAPEVFLERKTRKGDAVRKKRVAVHPQALPWLTADEAPADWPGCWFRERVLGRGLRPACLVGYTRTAFVGVSAGSPVRLTLDRHLVGAPAGGWGVPVLAGGLPLFEGEALVELKFHNALPELFRGLLPELPPQGGRLSKYRACVERCGLARATPGADASPHPA